jgi:hypothetical protein
MGIIKRMWGGRGGNGAGTRLRLYIPTGLGRRLEDGGGLAAPPSEALSSKFMMAGCSLYCKYVDVCGLRRAIGRPSQIDFGRRFSGSSFRRYRCQSSARARGRLRTNFTWMTFPFRFVLWAQAGCPPQFE